jgi:hypothetical protein
MAPGLLGGGASSFELDGTKGSARSAADWTVFVYVAADNNLSRFATKDLQEMQAGLTSSRVRFVAMVDQAQQGDSRIVEISTPADGEPAVQTVVDDRGAVIPASREVDSGSPETLKKFVEWGTANYPSRRSMFVIWNHGGGAFADPSHLKSFCWDDVTDSHLNLVDLWRVAQSVSSRTKFDIMGFDVCLLGHIETAYQLSRVSDFLVSSEKTEPGDGWEYGSLAQVLSKKPTIYPREFAAEIVKSYGNYYNRRGSNGTLSAIDLEKLKSRVVPAVNDLGKDLLANSGNAAVRASLVNDFKQALMHSASGNGEAAAIDLGYTAQLLTQDATLPASTRTLAGKVSQEFQRSVVANVTTGRTSNQVYQGLKVYFDLTQVNPNYTDPSKQFFGTTSWAQFVQAFAPKI